VLVPRPETELLVDLALERMRPMPHPRVLDLGTGSGCIAVSLALERPEARVTATDASAAALAVARHNAERLGAAVEFRLGDWYGAVEPDARFDLVVANPPYVAPLDPHLEALRHEPLSALTDSRDGLACLEAIVAGAAAHLVPSGWLLVEHGFDQAASVQALFRAAGWAPQSQADAAGHARVTFGQA
jgi:release factor glutamine methyltransferase